MSDITVVMPTSSIPSHPDTAILEETVASVRHHLPDVEIMLQFDGLRPEHAYRFKDYHEYQRRALWLADHLWGNVRPTIFDRHMHQSGMMTAALLQITTPLVLYVEHDTPLVIDETIPFAEFVAYMIDKSWSATQPDLIRLHHEAVIPQEHEHLIGTQHSITGYDKKTRQADSYMSLTETWQWSQRPHLATTAFYRRIMDAHFTPERPSFIEDVMHGVVESAVEMDGRLGWRQYRLMIYTPAPSFMHKAVNIKRSYHLDGRAGEEKYA